MSTKLKDKEEKIIKILNALAEEAAKGTLIIVEGKKDVKTLQDLEVTGNFISAKTGGKSFLDITTEIEQVGATEVVLLLDFDRRGKQGIKRLKANLERAKIRPNITFWQALQALLGREIQCIEGIKKYLLTLRAKINPSAA